MAGPNRPKDPYEETMASLGFLDVNKHFNLRIYPDHVEEHFF
jgi:hypothetical protein